MNKWEIHSFQKPEVPEERAEIFLNSFRSGPEEYRYVLGCLNASPSENASSSEFFIQRRIRSTLRRYVISINVEQLAWSQASTTGEAKWSN